VEKASFNKEAQNGLFRGLGWSEILKLGKGEFENVKNLYNLKRSESS